MANYPTAEEMLSSARQYLHLVILEQRAAIEELQANNRVLATILEEFLSVRGGLRAVPADGVAADGVAPDGVAHDGVAANDGDGHHFGGLEVSLPKAASKHLDLKELQLEASRVQRTGQHAMRESARLRQRSHTVRVALQNSDGHNHKPALTDHNGLSKRERQVLSLIVAGKSSKQIAAELGISFKTAVTHRASLMSKLQVHEVASVVRVAILRGLT